MNGSDEYAGAQTGCGEQNLFAVADQLTVLPQ
jgi:hypothetical protein